ncbi:MAG: metal-dependent transcriptional regulator [Actinomycetales bacterium]|nr:metal-dependent transcriptional regulator [Actinomycetales bacterium]
MTADLIDTVEMYLRTILELEEEGQVPMRARIAERLEQSGPTVSQTCARMERLGLLIVSDDRHLELTPAGRHEAVAVMRKHRLAERLLADVIGLEWELIHEEACRWEHVMSDRVEKRILELLEVKDVSPYGNPIPGLEELGHVSEFKQDGVVAIADLPPAIASQGTVTLRRISEQLQLDADMLADLRAAGVMPGQKVSLTFEAERVGINAAGMKPVWLNREETAQLFVDEA